MLRNINQHTHTQYIIYCNKDRQRAIKPLQVCRIKGLPDHGHASISGISRSDGHVPTACPPRKAAFFCHFLRRISWNLLELFVSCRSLKAPASVCSWPCRNLKANEILPSPGAGGRHYCRGRCWWECKAPRHAVVRDDFTEWMSSGLFLSWLSFASRARPFGSNGSRSTAAASSDRPEN